MQDSSYRALLALPSVAPLLLGMQIARIAQSMVGMTIVLYTLSAYRSAPLAGAATFCSVFPGLVVSPLAGALLDRHGRTRLVVLDYLVALASLALMGVLALVHSLHAWLLISIAAISSVTGPLSNTGLRTAFPLIVPKRLWERMNALDSTGFIVATLVGPPLAATIVALWGGAVALLAIAAAYGVAALVIARAHAPASPARERAPLVADAWHGLVYAWRNPTIRGLGFSVSTLNLSSGITAIVVPLILLERLHYSETIVGLVIASQGLTGIVSAFYFGRVDSRNRERIMLAVPMIAMGCVIALLLARADLITLAVAMCALGVCNGPLDIALFTLRQRRTDPAQTGRAFAVSMSFNYLGVPVGSAITGVVAATSIEGAIAFGAVAAVCSGFLALGMIPRSEQPQESKLLQANK